MTREGIRESWRPALLVAAVAAAAYARTLSFGLVWDDPGIVGYVARLLQEHGLAGLLRAEFLLEPEGASHTGYYRPIVLLSFASDMALARLLPPVFHLTNVALHAANAALVWLLIRAVTGSPLGALFGGILFALHPVHVESVAFVSARTDLWATLFVLFATLAWMHRSATEATSVAPQVTGGIAFLAALLSKEVAVVLPVVLLVADARCSPVLPAEGSWLRRNRGWALSWGVALAAAVAIRMLGAGVDVGTHSAVTWAAEARAAPLLFLRILLTYLRLLIAPWPLAPYYTASDLRFPALGVLGAAVVFALCLAASRRRGGSAGWLGAVWIVGFLLPVSGIVPIAGAIVAERFLYLPSVGLCLAAGGALARVFDIPRLRRPAAIASGMILAAALAATVAASEKWRDERALFENAVRTSPASSIMHFNYASALYLAGRLEEAAREYAVAAALSPKEAEPHYLLAEINLQLGRAEDAARESREALARQPTYPAATNILGVASSRLGRHEEAAAAFLRSAAGDPRETKYRFNLGLEYAVLGRWGDAAAAFAEALRLDPNNTAARGELERVRTMLSAPAPAR